MAAPTSPLVRDVRAGVLHDDAVEREAPTHSPVTVRNRRNCSAVYKARYLGPLTLGALVRLGLESQLKRVRGWTSSLESEPEEALRKLGKRLAKVIVGGDAALAQRGSAAGARATHRAREITSLVADINAVRRDTYGALVRLGIKGRRPKDWPERFFRRGASSKVGAPNRGPVDPPTG